MAIQGVTTRTKRSKLHWATRAFVIGSVIGAISLPLWAGWAARIWRFEWLYWHQPAPLQPQHLALQGVLVHWACSTPISTLAWFLTLLTFVAVSAGTYAYEEWSTRPLDASKPNIIKEK
ncbi:MAG: hypothetical protein KGJ74_11805 [Betaproteobacteria bacterium]|nr:hypothetical protein [Betaproteobacteria bacterium]